MADGPLEVQGPVGWRVLAGGARGAELGGPAVILGTENGPGLGPAWARRGGLIWAWPGAACCGSGMHNRISTAECVVLLCPRCAQVRRLREHGPPVEVAPPPPRGDHVHAHPHAHTQQGHGHGDKQQQQQQPRVSAAA